MLLNVSDKVAGNAICLYEFLRGSVVKRNIIKY